MPRCKAPEYPEEWGVLGCTPQRRRMRETLQMGVFQQPNRDLSTIEMIILRSPPLEKGEWDGFDLFSFILPHPILLFAMRMGSVSDGIFK